MMRTDRRVRVLVTVLLFVLGYAAWASWQIFGKQGQEDGRGTGQFPEVIRTNGGLLEVATLKYRRTFDLANAMTVLGYQVPFCHETASYTFDTYTTYRIRLAKRWPVDYYQGRLVVIAPPLEPALPVAFDTKQLKQALSRCRFFPSLGTQEELLRSISGRLALYARSPEYLSFVKDHGVHGGARDTVREFVQKWMTTQKGRIAPDTPIDVTFAGDPVGR